MAGRKEAEKKAREEAERKEREEREAAEAEAARKRRRRIFLVPTILLCAGMAATAAWGYLARMRAPEAIPANEPSIALPEPRLQHVLDLEAHLIDGRRVSVSLDAEGVCDLSKVPGFEAQARDALIMLFSGTSAGQCLYSGDTVRAEVTGRLNRIAEGCVDRVYFSEFLVK